MGSVRRITGRTRFQICLNKCYKQNHIIWTTYGAADRAVCIMDRSVGKTHPRKIETCAPRSLLNKAHALKDRSDGFDRFLEMLGQVLPSLRSDGQNVYLEFSGRQCCCPIVRFYPSLEFPSSWCSCSTEWAQLFKAASGRQVKAELEKSVLKGDDVCKVRVILAQ